MKKLYHGSNVEIEKPDLAKSKPYKDFGQGFYLSPGKSQAQALAKQKTAQLQEGQPYRACPYLSKEVMRLTEEQIKFMQEDLSIEIIQILMDEWECNMLQAMEMYYNSDTFERLCNPATGLYYQSAGYVYDYLKTELTTGALAH